MKKFPRRATIARLAATGGGGEAGEGSEHPWLALAINREHHRRRPPDQHAISPGQEGRRRQAAPALSRYELEAAAPAKMTVTKIARHANARETPRMTRPTIAQVRCVFLKWATLSHRLFCQASSLPLNPR